MKEIIAKINKTKSWFLRRKTKLTNPQPDSSRKKERIIKSTKVEIVVKIKKKKTKSWFFEKINKFTNSQPDSSGKKERRIKSTALERKTERLQQTRHKCKG